MKKQTHYLKGLRVLLAILFFIPILLYFVDFASKLPNELHALLHLQIVSAILEGAIGVIIFQFFLVLLFGRIYCSVICPAGVLQDAINRLFCIGKKKRKGTMRFAYKKPLNIFRYTLLAITVLLALFGITELIVWSDPYSNFGRIAANLFRPAVIGGNNILAGWLMSFDNYTLYHVALKSVMLSGVVAGFIILITFVVMVVFRGRFFCNTLCPAGTLLSLVSRYSFFRISFNKSVCNSCGNCERTCKAEAIDSKNMNVDTSRCVDCFNCTSSCTKGGLAYRFNPFYKKEAETAPHPSRANHLAPDVNSRRTFLATSATVAATLPVVSALAEKADNGEAPTGEDWEPVTPPGAISLERFKDKCTGCHICVVKCPTQILKPAGLEYGFGYLLRPHVSYKTNYCNYECTVCGDVCPSQAIKSLSVEEKKTIQVGIATFIMERCIVYTEGTDCGACSEHCPTQAVHMTPYKGTLTIPKVESELCIGCGGCQSICPVNPHRAIIIKANNVHQIAELPPEEDVKEFVIDDFGF
ncbi:MAG: 4Fe-4S dicluster domain-containing protein [Tannerellaceae bacterium]|jgi:ferredoxin|nr:4Fe-4S dicluster domain-containing protein [Tannerellaceae bacterium]